MSFNKKRTGLSKKPDFSYEELIDILVYCPETGNLTWKNPPYFKSKAGMPAGYLDCKGYKVIAINGREYMAHRIAWMYMTGCWPKDGIDHVNQDITDNSFKNLREATIQQNCCNKGLFKSNRTGYKGVSKTPSGRYRAFISSGNKNKSLGTFDSPVEAARAYDLAAIKYYGDFAATNKKLCLYGKEAI